MEYTKTLKFGDSDSVLEVSFDNNFSPEISIESYTKGKSTMLCLSKYDAAVLMNMLKDILEDERTRD